MSNIIKIIFFIVGTSIIYKYSKNPVIIFLSSKTIPKNLESYKSIHEAPLVHDNYEIIPLFNQKKGKYDLRFSKRDLIFYDCVSKSNYILANGKNDRITVYLKLNNRGDLIDSISIDDPRLFNCGVFFEHDYYIDWFRTGDTAKKKYSQVIYEEDLSLDQIKTYIGEAIEVDVGISYYDRDSTKIELFLLNKNGWSVLRSKKLYDELKSILRETYDLSHLYQMQDSETFSMKLDKHLGHFQKRFIIPKTEEFLTLEEKCVVEIEAFRKEERYDPPFFSLRSKGRPGWHGTGFIKLKYKSTIFPFKKWVFEDDHGYISRNFALYYPITEISKEFIIVSANPNDLYIFRPKNFADNQSFSNENLVSPN
ncbi:hypothetical protein [Flavivirga algicola]|uniref:DUF4221 domain-containing protein n=1 Tax=Flavivirga algicola TaxID=2729136 RepID=A0ABX1S1C3_9FLAO|nr:hypothetical protein [Flavivirga algicola]NMH89667.1 hypothetical protein [Flavivirga algicola]